MTPSAPGWRRTSPGSSATFWWSLLWAIVGWLVLFTLGLILIGIPIAFAIWFVAGLWVIYRVVRGYLLFKDSKAIPGV